MLRTSIIHEDTFIKGLHILHLHLFNAFWICLICSVLVIDWFLIDTWLTWLAWLAWLTEPHVIHVSTLSPLLLHNRSDGFWIFLDISGLGPLLPSCLCETIRPLDPVKVGPSDLTVAECNILDHLGIALEKLRSETWSLPDPTNSEDCEDWKWHDVELRSTVYI